MYCATVGFGDITSANIVGYTNNEVGEETVSGTIDIGVAFNQIGGGNFTVADKLFATEVRDGDVCLIFNPVAYNYDWYQYYADYEGKPAWGITDMVSFDENIVDSFNVNSGDSLVFIPSDPFATPKIVVAGEVADLNGASRIFVVDPDSEDQNDTMKPIVNPYPVDTTARMLSDFIEDGDVLLVWNDAAYNYDWVQFYADYEGKPAWGVTDMVTYEETILDKETDVILKSGHGAVFIPAVGGIRTWSVTLSE